MMPTYDEMMQRLQDADLFGTWEPLDDFHRNLMWQLRESPTSGIGLVTAWHLSAEDVFGRPQYRGMTGETFRRVAEVEFNRVVDTITPSVEVAEQAKAFQRQLREEAAEPG